MQAIPDALIRPFRSRRQVRAEESLIPIRSAHWYFSSGNLAVEPSAGDEIEDESGDRWTVLEVNRSDLNRIWQCVSQCYAVKFGLDEHVDHLRVTHMKTSAGTLRKHFHTLKSGIPAKISACTRTFRDRYGEICYALIQESLDAESGDALRLADDTLFEITKIQKPFFPVGWTEIELTNCVPRKNEP